MRQLLPNFFVAGAARSGTTSLWDHLIQHPEIFMPSGIKNKEPGYFSDNYSISDFDEYVSLFKIANEKMIGEASGAYLTSPESPGRIKDMIPEAKFIIMLRNPADRAYSLYNWMVKEGYEYIQTFEKALQIEKSRRLNNPAFMKTSLIYYYNYLYFHSGLYSEQVKRYFENFPEDKVLFIIFEEFRENVNKYVQEAYAFLGVDSSFVPEIKIHNKGSVPYSARIQFFLRNKFTSLLNHFHFPRTEKVVSWLMALNIRNKPPLPMKKETRRRLIDSYKNDIQNVSNIIHKDLSFWLD